LVFQVKYLPLLAINSAAVCSLIVNGSHRARFTNGFFYPREDLASSTFAWALFACEVSLIKVGIRRTLLALHLIEVKGGSRVACCSAFVYFFIKESPWLTFDALFRFVSYIELAIVTELRASLTLLVLLIGVGRRDTLHAELQACIEVLSFSVATG
jgi:hypothetical protein